MAALEHVCHAAEADVEGRALVHALLQEETAAAFPARHPLARRARLSLKDLANDDEPLLHDLVEGTLARLDTGTHPLHLGGKHAEPEGSFHGVLDDVRLSAGPLRPPIQSQPLRRAAALLHRSGDDRAQRSPLH